MSRVKKWIKRGCVAAALVGLFGVSGAALSNLYVKARASSRIHTLDAEAIPSRQVAIVLGARVMPSGEPSPALADRLHAALTLYQRGKVERVLVTGDHATRGYNEVAAMFQWLHTRGVPAEHIFVDHAGLHTFDSMYRASEVFNIQGAIVCTQEFHLARSIFLARAHGIDAVGAIADRRVYAKRRADATREFIARTVAIGDVYLWRRRPRRRDGVSIPIDGDAKESWDETITMIAERE